MSAPIQLVHLRLLVACITLTLVPIEIARAQSGALFGPEINGLSFAEDGSLITEATVPPGYRHAVLEIFRSGAEVHWESLVAGPMTGASATLTFTTPNPGNRAIVRVRVGDDLAIPSSTYSGAAYFKPVYAGGGTYIDSTAENLQTLNRVTYGASASSYSKIESIGATAFIEEQLSPETIDESANTELNDRMADLFLDYIPGTGEKLLEQGDAITYFKGFRTPASEPPGDWMSPSFDDATWLTGVSGLGYDTDGEDLYATELIDMPGNYSTVYVRHDFEVSDPVSVENLLLNLVFDDGFVAYLNGTEVARFNVSGTPPPHTAETVDSGGFESDDPTVFDLTPNKDLLVAGTNTLAIQLVNASLSGSSDAALIAEILSIGDPSHTAIRSINDLQHLIHIRGIYSEKQLQATLAAFWENHFTTDYDKVQDYIEDLDEFDALPDGRGQSRIEAATIEWEEYDFFYNHALGNFGDLLLYSATSPSMLIYLDGILNRKDAPNENYAREIFELSAFGVDNRYTQADLEELARCFTGWSVRKVSPELRKPFPQSARSPFTNGSISVANETAEVAIGATWNYFKGTAEPPATWKDSGFDDSSWDPGASGFGFADGDDATEFTDMRYNYTSFYTRKEFTIDPSAYESIAIEIDYDDGYVAYLNGTEIGRSNNMDGTGTPPPFDATANYGHSAEIEGGTPDLIDLAPFGPLLLPAPQINTLAVQLHNTTLTSSDTTLRTQVLGRTLTSDSINPADPSGVWTFWFNPEEHDLSAKVIFPGTAYEIQIPAITAGNEADGINGAIDVIDSMVGHPSTAEFISVKLVNKFVSDEISLDTYHSRTAPEWLLAMVDDAITAWNSTSPAGNIKTVMASILDPQGKVSGFWLEGAHLSKIKDPVEFVNSSFRAIGANIDSDSLPDRTEDMGMLLFQRDDPDGFSEKGIAWSDTLGLLERLKLAQGLATNRNHSRGDWDIDAFTTPLITTPNLYATPEDVIDHLDEIVFNNKLGTVRRAVFLEFANTDDAGEASPFGNLNTNGRRNRLADLTALILSAPEFQFQ